MITCTTNSAI